MRYLSVSEVLTDLLILERVEKNVWKSRGVKVLGWPARRDLDMAFRPQGSLYRGLAGLTERLSMAGTFGGYLIQLPPARACPPRASGDDDFFLCIWFDVLAAGFTAKG